MLRYVASCLMIIFSATACLGDQTPATKPATIIGIVKPAAANAEEAATVTANKVRYKILKDAKGKVVARDAAGKKAEIRGTIEKRAGALWITVRWCALVE